MKRIFLTSILLSFRLLAAANTAPIITNGPVDVSSYLGATNVAFIVAASGTTPFTYQWRQGTNSLLGATNSSYAIDFFQIPDLGSYSVIVSNIAGSATSTNAVLSVGCLPTPSGITGWWQGENNALDFVKGRNGSVSNGVTYTNGIVGTAFHFDGTTDANITCGTNAGNFFTNDFTVELWLRTTNTGYTQAVAEKMDNCGAHPVYWLIMLVSGCPYIGIGDSNSPPSETYGNYTTAVNDGKWHHVAFTRNQTVIKVYRDGTNDWTGTCPKIYSVLNAFNFRLGQGRCAPPFLGDMDEISTYSRALSSNEIMSIVLATNYGKCCYGPLITAQPSNSLNKTNGSTATFSVTAQMTPPSYYQWRKNGATLSDGANITGSTTSALTVSTLSDSDVATYNVALWNNCDGTNSVSVSLVGAPYITSQPTGFPTAVGNTEYMSVGAGGTETLTYKWRKGTSALTDITNYAGMNTATLTILTVRLVDNTNNFNVVITNLGGSVTSSNVTVTVLPQISISSQTTNAYAIAHSSNATMSVSVTGTSPAYQWKKGTFVLTDTSHFAGMSSSSLTILNAKGTDVANNFHCIITNASGVVNSANITLSVTPDLSSPSNQTGVTGGSVTFSVAATGTAPFFYQWRSNFSIITNATSSTYTLTNLDPSWDGNSYDVLVNNSVSGWFLTNGGGGVSTSVVAVLHVAASVVTFAGPSNGTVCVGETATYSVTGTGAAPISYQWYSNYTAIPGVTNTTYTATTNAQPGNTIIYSVIVSNAWGTQSVVDELIVHTDPVIASQPQNLTIGVDCTARFSVTATGNSPFTYQWLKNSTPISGATQTAYSISHAAAGDAGTYSVTVANECHSTNSQDAVLIVNDPPACAGDPTNMIAWWQFETNVLDHLVTYNGAATNISFITGRVGYGVQFNGLDSTISFGTTVGNFGTNDFTVEFWINTTSTAQEEAVMEKRDVCNFGSWWNIRIGGGGTVPAGALAVETADHASGGYTSLVSPTLVNDGFWHHIALVRNGLSLAIYIDGILDISTTSPTVYNVSNSVDFRLGRSICQGVDITQPYSGALDELSLYNRALTTNEISSIYNASITGKCP